ncbi:Crp/Fnr family transcriptional regulator [Brevundimonas sp.]|uniref:Crp/Fnr family transcriptional regulator n=1 Tax=Brevundimonas sp. TaxID=1871086 RepID=UPI0035B0CC68
MSEKPFGNRFLDALSLEDRQALTPRLRAAFLETDQIIIDQGSRVSEVHFPIDAQLANQVRFPDGRAIETAVVGREGLSGLAPFMADTVCAWEVVVRSGGRVHVIDAQVLRSLSEERPSLMRRLLALTDFYQTQASQTAACNALHPVLPRVARWLLTARDLADGDRIRFTQEEFARLLGAQRSTVSEAAHQLKARALIDYRRGQILIRDRAGLEAVACDCYGLLRAKMAEVGLG